MREPNEEEVVAMNAKAKEMNCQRVKDFNEAEAKEIIKELISSPMVMLKLQKQLMAVGFALYMGNQMDSLNTMVQASFLVNALDVTGDFVKEQYGKKIHNRGGDSSTN